MKNNLKETIDTALRDMDWHGEAEVLQAVRAKKKPGISLGRIPTRTLVLAIILMTVIVGTALALGITFSIRYQIQRQAAEAVKSTYGLTDEMLDLFTYRRENTENGWIASFESNAFHQKELGFYTVEKEADGTLSVTWSNDNADQELVASGELTSPAWGVKQLARIISFYRQHLDRWKNVQNMDDLSLEDKAALDAPLMEAQEIGLLINIVPEKDDIPVETAKEIARIRCQRRCAFEEKNQRILLPLWRNRSTRVQDQHGGFGRLLCNQCLLSGWECDVLPLDSIRRKQDAAGRRFEPVCRRSEGICYRRRF